MTEEAHLALSPRRLRRLIPRRHVRFLALGLVFAVVCPRRLLAMGAGRGGIVRPPGSDPTADLLGILCRGGGGGRVRQIGNLKVFVNAVVYSG